MLLKYFESKANEEELKKFILSEFESPDTGPGKEPAREASLDALFKRIMKKRSGK